MLNGLGTLAQKAQQVAVTEVGAIMDRQGSCRERAGLQEVIRVESNPQCLLRCPHTTLVETTFPSPSCEESLLTCGVVVLAVLWGCEKTKMYLPLSQKVA